MSRNRLMEVVAYLLIKQQLDVLSKEYRTMNAAAVRECLCDRPCPDDSFVCTRCTGQVGRYDGSCACGHVLDHSSHLKCRHCFKDEERWGQGRFYRTLVKEYGITTEPEMSLVTHYLTAYRGQGKLPTWLIGEACHHYGIKVEK